MKQADGRLQEGMSLRKNGTDVWLKKKVEFRGFYNVFVSIGRNYDSENRW